MSETSTQQRTPGGSFKSDYPLINAVRWMIGLDPIPCTEKKFRDGPGVETVRLLHTTSRERIAFFKSETRF